MRSKFILLLLIVVLGFCIRFFLPFINDFEKPPLHGPDAHYHTRRMLLGVRNYPGIPVYDSYLSYPAGGYVIWPLGYDFAGATIGYLLFGKNASEKIVEWVCAIYPILWGLLSIIFAYLLGRKVINEQVGLIASFFVAVLPCNAWWSALGYNDHHIAEALVLVALFYLLVRIQAKKMCDWILIGAVMGIGMLLWQGAILFAGLLFCVFLVTREFESIYSYIIALLIILPFSINTHFVDSPFSYRGLSLLHIVLLLIAILIMAIFFLLRKKPRILVCLPIVGLAILLFFLFQEKGFWGGISFITKKDPWLETILEFKPLLIQPDVIETITLKSLYGYSYYIWPIGLFMMLWENKRKEIYLFGFFAIFAGIMAFIARRYSVWFSPFYAIILGYIIVHIYKLVSKIAKKSWCGVVFCGIMIGIVMDPVMKYGYDKIHWTYHSKVSFSAYQWLSDSTPETS
ncbi:MAG: glycosyltransferase family 39 protein, partial [candidate division WOR-3 bacterium]